MNYSFDIERFSRMLLPSFFRKPRLLGLLKALTTPLVSLYSNFLSEGAVIITEARMTAQVSRLEVILNSKFDPEKERVKITHAQDYSITLSDARALTLSDSVPLIIHDNIVSDLVDFHVQIPTDFTLNFQTVINDAFDYNKPLVLSDAISQSLSNSTSLSVLGIYDQARPITLSNIAPVNIPDIRDIHTVTQITALVKKYKLAGKKFSLNI